MSDATLCLVIGALIVLDGGFGGYRARAGRYARIRRTQHDLRAVVMGCAVAAGAALVTAVAAMLLGTLHVSAGPALEPEARTAAWRILWVAGGYATLVVLAFAPFLTGTPDLRSLTTVVLFGPFTLLRPVVVIGACVLAAWGQPRAIIASVAVGCALVLMQDVILERLGRLGARL